MNIGDTITCHDTADLIKTMIECAKSGIETDFEYGTGQPTLVVTEVREEHE